MGQYIYAPAGPANLKTKKAQACALRKCVEFIGSTCSGHGSNLAKGKRYLKSTVHCSGAAIKHTMQSSFKVIQHNFQTYGLVVLRYHKDACAEILKEITRYIITEGDDAAKTKALGCIPQNNAEDECLHLIFDYRLSHLGWVKNQNYKDQGGDAAKLCDKFGILYAPSKVIV